MEVDDPAVSDVEACVGVGVGVGTGGTTGTSAGVVVVCDEVEAEFEVEDEVGVEEEVSSMGGWVKSVEDGVSSESEEVATIVEVEEVLDETIIEDDATSEVELVGVSASEEDALSVVELGMESVISSDEELSEEVDDDTSIGAGDGNSAADPPPETVLGLEDAGEDELSTWPRSKNQLKRNVALLNIFPPGSAPEKFPQKI
jgi:hypothetical protein